MSLENLENAYYGMRTALNSMPACIEDVTGISSDEFEKALNYLSSLSQANIQNEEVHSDSLPELSEYEKMIIKKWSIRAEYHVMGEKTTICLLTLRNGFEVVGTSAPIKAENFAQQIGNLYALKDALNKVGELDGFTQHVE